MLLMLYFNYYSNDNFRWFAWVMTETANVCNRLTFHVKANLFAPLKDIVSSDSELKAKKQFRLLEIGCGSGETYIILFFLYYY